jgi:hypothetical protein
MSAGARRPRSPPSCVPAPARPRGDRMRARLRRPFRLPAIGRDDPCRQLAASRPRRPSRAPRPGAARRSRSRAEREVLPAEPVARHGVDHLVPDGARSWVLVLWPPLIPIRPARQLTKRLTVAGPCTFPSKPGNDRRWETTRAPAGTAGPSNSRRRRSRYRRARRSRDASTVATTALDRPSAGVGRSSAVAIRGFPSIPRTP